MGDKILSSIGVTQKSHPPKIIGGKRAHIPVLSKRVLQMEKP